MVAQEHQQWIARARALFDVARPEHFTNFNHCDECAEHDETLRSTDVDHISMEQLGSSAWDPISFASVEGKIYYTPALIRISLETVDGDFYLDQFLFHLMWDGKDNLYYLGCTPEQRAFIAEFLAYMLETYSDRIEECYCGDQLLQAYEIWSC